MPQDRARQTARGAQVPRIEPFSANRPSELFPRRLASIESNSSLEPEEEQAASSAQESCAKLENIISSSTNPLDQKFQIPFLLAILNKFEPQKWPCEILKYDEKDIFLYQKPSLGGLCVVVDGENSYPIYQWSKFQKTESIQEACQIRDVIFQDLFFYVKNNSGCKISCQEKHLAFFFNEDEERCEAVFEDSWKRIYENIILFDQNFILQDGVEKLAEFSQDFFDLENPRVPTAKINPVNGKKLKSVDLEEYCEAEI